MLGAPAGPLFLQEGRPNFVKMRVLVEQNFKVALFLLEPNILCVGFLNSHYFLQNIWFLLRSLELHAMKDICFSFKVYFSLMCSLLQSTLYLSLLIPCSFGFVSSNNFYMKCSTENRPKKVIMKKQIEKWQTKIL